MRLGRKGSKTVPRELTHVGSGKYSDVFKLAAGAPPVMMKVSFYRDSTLCEFIKRAAAGDMAGARRVKKRDSIAVGNQFAKLTMRLLESVSPHFVVVYCDEDCKAFAPRLGALLRERLDSLSPLQRRINNLCFMEPFDSNLSQFLLRGRYGEAHLRAVLFQVLYTLAALQKLLPGFRHNDLSTNNVLVKRLHERGGMSARYRVGEAWFAVQNLPVLVALSDYDFLHVPGSATLSNERVTNGMYKVDGARNASYDVHFFLKAVLKCLVSRGRLGSRAFAATRAFLRGLGLREEDRQNAEIPGLDPRTVLRSAYFAPLAAAAAASRKAFEFSYAF